jgi:hypothetical protein
MSKKYVDSMEAHPFSSYSDVPEDYRILKSQWKMVENVLNSLGKFGPGVDEMGNDTLGDYRTVEIEAKVGLGEEEVVFLRTHDPEVKKILAGLISRSKEKGLPKITPEPTLPKLRENSIKPLGEVVEYHEYETVMVAPMDAETVRDAFEHYNGNYQDRNRLRKMDEQLRKLRENDHYTLKEIRVPVKKHGKTRTETHTMIIPSEEPDKLAEFDRAMNSGEIPLGNELYAIVYPLPREMSAVDAGDGGTDTGKRKAKRR